ncbi:hypothetical protein M422DRAFT_268440 [Sphaerobolus stellatus SS14]|uniref:Uncharacterized protein n=1 Tax=Sphaerobolus stellatus (strain SS14) TaxID=990650 RepID=A0A0C9UMN1_SPHS4|nr:hypothetical protein M422DRAFT_268440 [Sphaerobolus stellatus SS14]
MSCFYDNDKWNHLQFEDILIKMQEFSLLQIHNGSQIIISIHPLVAEWLQMDSLTLRRDMDLSSWSEGLARMDSLSSHPPNRGWNKEAERIGPPPPGGGPPGGGLDPNPNSGPNPDPNGGDGGRPPDDDADHSSDDAEDEALNRSYKDDLAIIAKHVVDKDGRNIKVRVLDTFNGSDPNKLHDFILGCRLYFRGNKRAF